MTAVDNRLPPCDLGGDAVHVCWVVDDDATYVHQARSMLDQGKAAGRKPLAFGPVGNILEELAPDAAAALDPRSAVLEGGPLQPEKMFAAFRGLTALAQREGFSGLCVVADMDWLLPTAAPTEKVVQFELLLDQVVSELDAVVVCAYRRSSFDTDAVIGTLSVHPVDVGSDQPPQFRLVADDSRGWRLSGEVDLGATDHLRAALDVAIAEGSCDIDVGDLDFMDVRGMGILAHAAKASHANIRLRGASAAVRRNWTLAGFDEYAPTVELVA